MKNNYLAVAGLLLATTQPTQAQITAWRPFRQGLIYHFQNNAADSLYTLRLDSAYAAGNDSILTFNRVMRRSGNSYFFIKSRNNQFGARLMMKSAGVFELQVQAEAGTGTPVPPLAATSVSLHPRAAVGSTWVAAGTVTATLTARTLRPVAGIFDSVAVITLSDGRVFEMSRRYGLVSAPRLLAGAGSGRRLLLHRLPQATPEYTAPGNIYDFQPGDEFGYTDRSQITPTSACTSYRTLTRILTRQQTSDSLIYTRVNQTLRTENEYSYCPGPLTTTLYGVYRNRVAYALRPTTNQGFDATDLLTFGYRLTSSPQLLLLPTNTVTNCGVTRYSSQVMLLQGQGYFVPMSDYPIAAQLVTGLGSVVTGSRVLTYYLKYAANGTSSVCGSNASYTTLLPTRAAQAATLATLHPNPAHEQATLTLATPAPAGTTWALLDVLGRQLWQQPVAPGATQLPVMLPTPSAGLYLLQLTLPGQLPLTYRLSIE